MFCKEELIELNKKFSNGNIVNNSSLEFALSSIKTKPWFDQIAYLVRAILIDHIFEDGNKRTAALVIIAYYTELEIGFDPQKIVKLIIDVMMKNITDLNKTKRMMKNVIR
jgi:prophage maintenance system killer protein|tara:strand:- start:1210 stop:1539 length:330 start_codon:yes stop_codon:yes gene_type:complete